MSLNIQDLYWFKMLLSKAGDLFFLSFGLQLFDARDFVLIVPVCKMTKPFRNCYKLHSRFYIFSHVIKKL
ncbi:hypothetical protein Peur_057860 [Populus x canadensis]